MFSEALKKMTNYNYIPYALNNTKPVTQTEKDEAWEKFEKYYALLTTARGIRGLESENVVVAINMEEYALRQNTAQAIARCIHKLTIITFEESESPIIGRTTNRNIVNKWKAKKYVEIKKYDFQQTQHILHRNEDIHVTDETINKCQHMVNK